MSYRSFKKRTLGETSLERKCRLLFGSCLLPLIVGSFWWYGSITDQEIYERNRFVGKALTNFAIFEAHLKVFQTDTAYQLTNEALADQLRSRDLHWEILQPENDQGIGKPTDAFEWDLMDQWTKLSYQLESDEDIDALESGPERPWAEPPEEDPSKYRYYQPIFTKGECIGCHRAPVSGVERPYLERGDLLAVLKLELDAKETLTSRRRNRAMLLVSAIATVVLSMLALYVIVRYIIVKPLRHLRDVSDAVRRGEVDQRAVIRTGDEFEDLGAAFNRMLRQLLRQQDELRSVNGELDGKIDEMAQANMRLFEMNQLKSDFLATVSHELRTPLNSIIGFSDLLGEVEALEDGQRRYATNIQQSGKQLLEMINDILDLAKIESGKMELRLDNFDIAELVATQCDLAQPLSKRKNIDLESEADPDLPLLRQDRGKIVQILNNLLSNAIKFTPDGGRISVLVRRDSRGDLRLTVADTGVGISESEQIEVFEKFRQGTTVLPTGNAMTREYSGTGLGLSIVRELCRLLGGDITLESELGKGSEFTVYLPWEVTELPTLETSFAAELKQLIKPRPEA